MKYLLSCLLFLSMAHCRDKNVAPETLQPLVGKWRLAAYEQMENGNKVWKEVDPQFVSFRFDGLILDNKGLPYCCPPSALNINGKRFSIFPKATVPENPTCAYIDCIGCATWEIELTGDEFILNLCGWSKSKYVRVP